MNFNKALFIACFFLFPSPVSDVACASFSSDPHKKLSCDIVTIPLVSFSDGTSWQDWCMNQRQTSTCTSHAVAHVLSYMHGIKNILPNYLHKYTQTDLGVKVTYDDGLSLKSAMNFACKHGVPVLPKGKQIQYNTGAPFPKGTPKYAFSSVHDIFTESWVKGYNKVEKIKYVIRECKTPVVTGSYSRYGDMRMDDHFEPIPDGWRKPKKINRHALVFWGYDNYGFFIKNSWGEGAWARKYTQKMKGGNAKLLFEYAQDWTDDAWVGKGTKTIEKDYQFNNEYLNGSGNSKESDCIFL